MSVIEIRDYAMWPKHIHGNNELKEKLLSLGAGDLFELEMDGIVGTWVKMDDGKDGRPTPGLKAIGRAKTHWHAMKDQWGEIVTIREAK